MEKSVLDLYKGFELIFKIIMKINENACEKDY